jgi:hypothetical protein
MVCFEDYKMKSLGKRSLPSISSSVSGYDEDVRKTTVPVNGGINENPGGASLIANHLRGRHRLPPQLPPQ